MQASLSRRRLALLQESTANAEEQETLAAMKELERETSRLMLKLVAVEEARQKDAELYEARLRTQVGL